MLMVTEGDKGTLRSHFKGFPVRTAAKTGTAEENKKRPSHSWFAGFAPYDNPQIAVVVLIPFGEGKSAPAINTGKEAILEYMGFNYEHKNGGIYENVLAR